MRSYALPLAVSTVLSFGCGGSDEQPLPVQTRTQYDESTEGPLPFNWSNLSPDQRAKFTFAIAEGTFTVRGTSNSGESFALSLPTETYLKSVSVSYLSPIDRNDHVLQITRVAGPGVFGNIQPMPTAGLYEFTLNLPDRSISAGVYEVYSGTSVQGTSTENPFSLRFVIAK